ncbi:hypothetical protein K8W59_04970 [Nocardioides rotundus]|uniref:hypothetical protein n=1 Tax=Nocardioides rotundus TaxID=1774216 RepID=UPI001CBFEBFE|nr:hypothetical protein [Nocardioides rotundus]UAL30857.1 hypothetical protein K8W59_04970 [Nocardioides rotundus]
MLYAVIITCEVLFWVFLFGGLAARYIARLPRLGATLLVMAPLVDVVTLGAAVLDLRAGGEPSFAHVLAAIFIGASVGFGHPMMRWADVRFAHRYAGGPAPAPKPTWGRAHAAHERLQWRRHLVMWAVSAGLLTLAALIVGGVAAPYFLNIVRILTIIVVIDGIVSLSYTFRPRPSPAGEPAGTPVAR